MSFQSIRGQNRVKRILQNSLLNNSVSHAYIFSGPAGTGRKAMALALAQAIYCKVLPDDACGVCLDCRKVLHRNHPDLLFIEPDGSSIKIDQIRGLQKEFAYRSTVSGTKIYIVDEADKMTVQAANSLLKFLEEPAFSVVAILITENGHALLPTIQSRSQWISFTPMSRKEMTELLLEEGHSPALVHCAVHLTAGVDAARELIQGNGFAEIRSLGVQLAKDSLTRLPTAMLTVQQKLGKSELSEQLPLLLDLLILWLKDMVQIHLGNKNNLVYIDQLDWMSGQALSKELSHWVSGMDRAVELQKRLRYHANPQLVLENMLLQLRGV
ncbi:DNA polymerase III subunit delta' [Paenibacillus thalictri]|uniref:DNA polymerase III subunit delta n=1 Tax=Paenibacillus thalictri TaxID=2527873 RepID=A0A4Q9DD44_9BACL|nr:DNA polymerase III subunit delta' [Paenibacillus thalictri]TBL69001.1 DNA polymerase III subunit delta' [Paenibacillus thalictri]